jgi:hypothetical protein
VLRGCSFLLQDAILDGAYVGPQPLECAHHDFLLLFSDSICVTNRKVEAPMKGAVTQFLLLTDSDSYATVEYR